MAKIKGLISFTVTEKLKDAFVFAYEKRLFSHDLAQFSVCHFCDLHVVSSHICFNLLLHVPANSYGHVKMSTFY